MHITADLEIAIEISTFTELVIPRFLTTLICSQLLSIDQNAKSCARAMKLSDVGLVHEKWNYEQDL